MEGANIMRAKVDGPVFFECLLTLITEMLVFLSTGGPPIRCANSLLSQRSEPSATEKSDLCCNRCWCCSCGTPGGCCGRGAPAALASVCCPRGSVACFARWGIRRSLFIGRITNEREHYRICIFIVTAFIGRRLAHERRKLR